MLCVVLITMGASTRNLPNDNVELKISLFNSFRIKKTIVTHGKGSYKIYGDGKYLGNLTKGAYISAEMYHGKISFFLNGANKGSFSKVVFDGQDYANNFKVRSVSPSSKVRVYEDDMELWARGNRMKIINMPKLNHYIAGVVESEVGRHAHIEYYKLQSIICRTYALSNIDKYADKGFNLCDEVNSQVYKGKSRSNPDILKATAATSGLVLIDNDLNLITATFHSNSGGQTMNSEDVWSQPVDYLRSVQDTFCLTEPHAYWTKTIALNDWMNYFKNKFGVDVNSPKNKADLTAYEQIQRDVYFTDKEVPLKTVRKDWKLNSTFFSIELKTDSVVLNGKGFGHGVGLCQEGAMRMAREGYSYKTILNKYYKNVNLVNLRALRFVQED